MSNTDGEDTLTKIIDTFYENRPESRRVYSSVLISEIAKSFASKELASLREQLKESNFWANEQANTLNALADRNAGLSSELEKSNHNYLSIVEQLKQQEEVIRKLIPLARMFVVHKEWMGEECKTEKAIIEKAKSLTTKDK